MRVVCAVGIWGTPLVVLFTPGEDAFAVWTGVGKMRCGVIGGLPAPMGGN
jgi:hypothetical protein